MTTPTQLQPTLWRTCRAIANRTRLQIFGLLLQNPDLTVSAVATRLKLPLPVASEYLRILEARGLLSVQRVGRRVKYRPGPATGEAPTAKLVAALRGTFQLDREPVETVFKLATAFTHPRRIQIFRVLSSAPGTLEELHAATSIPFRTMHRHLRKLEDRGFVISQLDRYAALSRSDPLGRELARLARQ